MALTREAKARIIRNLAKRIIALGGKAPDPETLNDSDESMLTLIEGLISLDERRAAEAK